MLFLGLAVVTHLDQLLGPYGFVDFYDTIEVHFSHFQNLFRLMAEYGPFSWYPFHGGGVPAFVGQHPPYHPAVLLAALMPYWLLSLLWNVGQMALAGWGMTRLLRQLAGLSRQASLLCGALSALAFINGNIHIVFGYAFPAFAVWTLEAFDTHLGRKARLFRCLGLFLLALLSFPVLTLPHFPIFHLALVLFLGRRRPDFARQVLAVFVVWTGYVLLFVPSIVSLYQYIPFAQRDWNFPEVTALAALASLAKAFKGRLVELMVFPLLLPSIYLLRKNRTGQVALLLVFVPLLVACIFGSDMKNFLANTFVVKMDLFLFTMLAGCASFLVAGLGFDALRREPGSGRLCLALAIMACFLRKGEYAVLSGLLLVLATAALFQLSRPDQRTLFRQGVLLSVLALGLAGLGMMGRQQYMAAGNFVPQASFERHHALKELAAEARAEPFRVGCLDVHPAVVQAYGLDTVGGKSPLFNRRYKQYVQQVVAPQLTSQELQAGFTTVWRQLYLTRDKADHDQRPLVLAGPERSVGEFNMPMLEGLGVRYLVSARPLRDAEGVAELVAVDGVDLAMPALLQGTEIGRSLVQPLCIYRLIRARPLGSLVRAEILPAGQGALQALASAPAETVRQTAFVEQADLQGTARTGLDAGAGVFSAPVNQPRLVSWAPDRLVFAGTAPGPVLLLLANNFDPRWTATCNGEPAPVVRANHAFQAVPLPGAGDFTVILNYHAPGIWWLHLASLAGCGLLFSGLVFRTRASGGLAAPAPAPASGPLLPVGCVLAGSAMALVWSLGFALFVLRKLVPGSGQALTMTYALLIIPLLGPCIGGWAAFFASQVLACKGTGAFVPREPGQG